MQCYFAGVFVMTDLVLAAGDVCLAVVNGVEPLVIGHLALMKMVYSICWFPYWEVLYFPSFVLRHYGLDLFLWL